jgi:hypothetical protein
MFAVVLNIGLFASFTSAALAAGVDDNTDIVGLNMNLSPQKAADYIRSQFKAAKVTKLTADVGTEYFDQKWDIGYYAEIVPTRNEQQRSATDRSGEFIKVINSPDSNDLIGIVHYTGYPKGAFITRAAVVQALKEKYGPPSSGGENVSGYFWVARANVWSAADTIWYTNGGKPEDCSLSGLAGGNSFLYERAGAFFQNGQTTFEPGESVSTDTSSSFTAIFNTINHNPNAFAKCGVVLNVLLGSADNSDYVSSITVRIVDFDRANEEIRQSNKAFWLKANKAQSDKLNSQSGNKPKL